MSDKRSEVSYRLSRSTVRLTATVTSDYDPRTSLPRRRVDAEVALAVEADPRPGWRCQVPIAAAFAKDRTLDLEFTDDGRLVTGKGTTTGVGASIIEAGVRTVAFVGSVVLGAIAGAKPGPEGGRQVQTPPEPPPPERSFEDVYAAEQPEAAARRTAYKQALERLQEKLADRGVQLSEDQSPRSHLPALRALQIAVERMRAESTTVEAEYAAWRATRFPSSSSQHEFVVGTDELPNRPTAPETLPDLDVSKLSQTQQDAAKVIGVVVVRVAEVDEDRLSHTEEALREAPGLWFRIARPVQLAVYEADPVPEADELPAQFKRTSLAWMWVVDSDSRMGFLGFDAGPFGKQTGSVKFGAAGTLVSMASADEAPARQIASAFSGLGDQVKGSLEQAQAVSDALDKARMRGSDRRLADLKRRKELLEEEIALKGALTSREDREELERLKREAELIEARKKVAPDPAPTPDPNAELRAELARTKLEVALLKLRVQKDDLTDELP